MFLCWPYGIYWQKILANTQFYIFCKNANLHWPRLTVDQILAETTNIWAVSKLSNQLKKCVRCVKLGKPLWNRTVIFPSQYQSKTIYKTTLHQYPRDVLCVLRWLQPSSESTEYKAGPAPSCDMWSLWVSLQLYFKSLSLSRWYCFQFQQAGMWRIPPMVSI